MVDKRNATGSWSGYLHQGKVGILLALIEINRLIKNQEDLLTWRIEYESAEDIDIKKESKVISRHQVKAYKNANFPNDYKDVRAVLHRDSVGNLVVKGFNTDNVSEENRFLHVIREVKGFDMSKEEFEEFYRNATFVPNLSAVRLYPYPNGKEYCRLDDYENNNDLKKFCIAEIEKILKFRKQEFDQDFGFKELKYLQLQELLDKRIRGAHLKGQSFFPKIYFREFIDTIFNTEKLEQSYIFKLRTIFSNCWVEYLIEIENEVSENMHKKFEEIIAKIYHLSDSDFLQFFRDMNPDKVSSTDKITNEEMIVLCNKDSIKDIFYHLLFHVENKEFKIDHRGYEENDGFLLTLINRPKSKVKHLIKNMQKNTRLTEAIFNKRYLINSQIDDISISENDQEVKNWRDATTGDNIFYPNMKFIDVENAIDKLNQE